MSEQRRCRVYYLACCKCGTFVLYDTESIAVSAETGQCPVCGSENKFTRPWKEGYVSPSEFDLQWSSGRPVSLRDLAVVQPYCRCTEKYCEHHSSLEPCPNEATEAILYDVDMTTGTPIAGSRSGFCDDCWDNYQAHIRAV